MQQPQSTQPQTTPPLAPGTLPPLAPVLDIPFPELGPGVGGHIALRFDPTSTRLMVQHYERNEPWPWLVDHRSDVSLVVLLLGVLVSLVLLLRIARRPQHRLCHYCRRCNYELAAPSRAPLDPCPECGTAASQRRPAVGKPRWVRSARVLLALAILGTACVLLISRDVRWRSSGAATWPVQDIDRYLAAWPFTRVMGSVDLRNRVHVLAIDTGDPAGTERPASFTHEAYVPPVFSPDGQTIAWIGRPDPQVPRLALYRCDVLTGSIESTPIPQTKHNAIECLGLSADGKTAVLVEAAPKMKVINGQVSRSEHESLLVDVYALSLNDGSFTKTYSTTFPAQSLRTRSLVPGLVFATSPGTGPQWILATTTDNGIRDVLVRLDNEVRPLSVAPYNGIRPTVPPVIVDADTVWFGNGESLSLANASFTRKYAVDSFETPATRTPWFIFMRDGVPVAELTAAAGFGGGYMPVQSPNGRWIAMAYMPNALTPSGPFRIRVWDTSTTANAVQSPASANHSPRP